MILHLIRHGETTANEQRLYCGHSDLPLSPRGISGLLELRGRAPYPKAELFFVSGLLRTRQTLEIIYHAPPYGIIAELREINFGAFELKRHEELLVLVAYRAWLEDTENTAPVCGESRNEFAERVWSGFLAAQSRCRAQGATAAAIVTHGGVIAVIMECLFPGQKNFYEWQPPCGRGYSLHMQDKGNIYFTKIQEDPQ